MRNKELFLKERSVLVVAKQEYLESATFDFGGYYRSPQKRKRDLVKWIKRGRPVNHSAKHAKET